MAKVAGRYIFIHPVSEMDERALSFWDRCMNTHFNSEDETSWNYDRNGPLGVMCPDYVLCSAREVRKRVDAGHQVLFINHTHDLGDRV